MDPIKKKVFVGKRFADINADINGLLEDIFSSLGLEVVTGEEPSQGPISKKIQNRILNCDLFAGILTRGDSPISRWVLEEISFAKQQRKKILLFQENGSPTGGLYGDDEYVEFHREALLHDIPNIIRYIRNSLDDNALEFPNGVKNLTSAGYSVTLQLQGLLAAITSDTSPGQKVSRIMGIVQEFLDDHRLPGNRSQIFDLIERDILLIQSLPSVEQFSALVTYLEAFPILRDLTLTQTGINGAHHIVNTFSNLEDPLHLVVYGHSGAVLAILRHFVLLRHGYISNVRVTVLKSDLMFGTNEHVEMADKIGQIQGFERPHFHELRNLKSLTSQAKMAYLVGCERIGTDGKVLHPTGIKSILKKANAEKNLMYVAGECYKVSDFKWEDFAIGARPDGSEYPLECIEPTELLQDRLVIVTDHGVHEVSSKEKDILVCCAERWKHLLEFLRKPDMKSATP